MLKKIFGKGICIQILETFLKPENREKWLNVREIGRQSNVSAGTISRRINELVQIQILIEQNPSQFTRIFKLNLENPYIPLVIDFFEQIKKVH
jgi:hypothetical protein